jgi:hypothetical protein
MGQWRCAVERDHTVIARSYAQPCAGVEGIEETPRKYRRAAGDTLVVSQYAGVFRTCTIIRLDCHVFTDALRRLPPFSGWKWSMDVHLNRLTTWLVYENAAKAAAEWLRLRMGGRLPPIVDLRKRVLWKVGPYPPRIVTSTLILAGSFWCARDAHWHDIATLRAMRIHVAHKPMDDSLRRDLWVPNLIPAADAETHTAAVAKLARALDTLERESTDPDTRLWCRLMREALERDNDTHRNA